MQRKLITFAITGIVAAAPWFSAKAQRAQLASTEADLTAPTVASGVIPPLPGGRSTILGGAIRDVDPVLDRLTLRIVGEKPMRILFDERTQVFVDGKRISLRDLKPCEHASIQTTLDGTAVFALSIHILSQLQSGEYRGEVVSYDASSGDLELATGAGGQPIRVRVSSETKFDRKGQGTFASAQSGPSDLQPGALVSLQFEPDGKGRGEATQITFLATPGSQFVFGGSLIALDMHTGTMVILDPKDDRSYQIAFNPASVPSIQNVHAGQRVRVTAEYDGTRYVARDVTVY